MKIHRSWPDKLARTGAREGVQEQLQGLAIFPEQPSYPQEQGSSWAHTEGSPTGDVLSCLPSTAAPGLALPRPLLPSFPLAGIPGPFPQKCVKPLATEENGGVMRKVGRPLPQGLAQFSSR